MVAVAGDSTLFGTTCWLLHALNRIRGDVDIRQARRVPQSVRPRARARERRTLNEHRTHYSLHTHGVTGRSHSAALGAPMRAMEPRRLRARASGIFHIYT